MKKLKPTKKEIKISDNKIKKQDERLRAQLGRVERRQQTPKFRAPQEGEDSVVRPKSTNSFEDWEHYIGLCEATASGSSDFHDILTTQILSLGNHSAPNQLNAGVAFLRGLEPKDEIETLLITQMFTAQILAMNFATRALKYDDPDLIDSNINRFNRLTKRFAEHVEMLDKHRGKGQQKVTVEHVHVHKGGQAIVGTVGSTGGEGNGKN